MFMYFVLKQNASLPDYQGVDVLRDRVTFQGPDWLPRHPTFCGTVWAHYHGHSPRSNTFEGLEAIQLKLYISKLQKTVLFHISKTTQIQYR